ncbi:major facilitator superfamily-like [Daphnia sinensis]|uniref:Major facilitator superfamily-like n=1 Tax=Daphnia sinensis TaxID=1820382 RepID=A0AAD5KD41_9CRUS|nr:major facilitator superfamily-like [Daphnia sinensis]KAI9549329.1 major facilitator superfamily-like [Daphnia sinensis]KAI9549403.1 major facilitator superfamily-like [Daphnia sinensis]
MNAAERNDGGITAAERQYGIVTAAYWGFTLTDARLRMLVLLHFYKLGYSPFTLAFLFLLYEGAGCVGQPDRRLAGHTLWHRPHAHRLAVGHVGPSCLRADRGGDEPAAHDGQEQAFGSAKELFAKSAGINALAAARVALFGARDVWFVVGVPVFLYSVGWTFTMVGGFLAAWTIGYGLVQALAPQLVRRSADGLSREVPAARWWSAVLTLIPLGIAAALWLQAPQLQWWVIGGLSLFGFAFAINSSVHSYLVLAYAGSEKRPRRGLLLRRQRAGPLHGHAAVRPAVPMGRAVVRPLGIGADAAAVLADHTAPALGLA